MRKIPFFFLYGIGSFFAFISEILVFISYWFEVLAEGPGLIAWKFLEWADRALDSIIPKDDQWRIS